MSSTNPSHYRLESSAWSLWRRLIPSAWRANLYQLVIRYASMDELSPAVHRLPFGLHAKYCWEPGEALAMGYVATHTTIPVPQILDIVPYDYSPAAPLGWPRLPPRNWLIVMQTLPGTPLSEGDRIPKASDEQLARITDTLANWIQQLRSCPSPFGGRVCGFLGGSLRSFRIDGDVAGPFNSVAEFHSQDFCTIWPSVLDSYGAPDSTRQMARERPNRHYEIKLVHGDLLPHNILADDDLNLTGLIDWECAGWMPEYWENATSTRRHYWRLPYWKDIVRDAFPKYDDDMEMELYIDRGYEFC